MIFEVYSKCNNKMGIALCEKTVSIIKELAGKDHEVKLVSLDKPSGYEKGLSNGVLYIPSVAAIDDLDADDSELGFLENVFQTKCGIGTNLWFDKVKTFVTDMVEEWDKKNLERAGSALKD